MSVRGSAKHDLAGLAPCTPLGVSGETDHLGRVRFEQARHPHEHDIRLALSIVLPFHYVVILKTLRAKRTRTERRHEDDTVVAELLEDVERFVVPGHVLCRLAVIAIAPSARHRPDERDRLRPCVRRLLTEIYGDHFGLHDDSKLSLFISTLLMTYNTTFLDNFCSSATSTP